MRIVITTQQMRNNLPVLSTEQSQHNWSNAMKILAFAASNSRKSINKQLVQAAADVLKDAAPGTEVEILDLNDYEMPIYSSDREAQSGIPDEAHRFFAKIGAADALIVSYAEHNGFYTAAFKNIFDWASRIDMRVFQDKPMVAMATSPGKGGGANVLNAATGSAGFFGADVRGTFSLASFYDSFDAAAGRPADPEKLAELKAAVGALALQPA